MNHRYRDEEGDTRIDQVNAALAKISSGRSSQTHG